MLDRRRFPRLDERWEFDCKAINSEEFRSDTVSNLLVNISGGGFCFETNEEINIGTMVAIELKSECFSSSIVALAKTIWCKKKNGKYEVGVEFYWIGWKDNNVQQEIAEYISQKIS